MVQMQGIEKLSWSFPVVVPLILQARLHAIPSVLALLLQFGTDFLRRAELKVSKTSITNTRETLEHHIIAHREEAERRFRCQICWIRNMKSENFK